MNDERKKNSPRPKFTGLKIVFHLFFGGFMLLF